MCIQSTYVHIETISICRALQASRLRRGEKRVFVTTRCVLVTFGHLCATYIQDEHLTILYMMRASRCPCATQGRSPTLPNPIESTCIFMCTRTIVIKYSRTSPYSHVLFARISLHDKQKGVRIRVVQKKSRWQASYRRQRSELVPDPLPT